MLYKRRLAKGQCFHQPYLGCRELAAEVLPVADPPPAEEVTQDLGLMLWDVEYAPKRNRPLFFHARLEHGVLDVPEKPALATGEAA